MKKKCLDLLKESQDVTAKALRRALPVEERLTQREAERFLVYQKKVLAETNGLHKRRTNYAALSQIIL